MDYLKTAFEIPLSEKNNLAGGAGYYDLSFDEKFKHILKFPLPMFEHSFASVTHPSGPTDLPGPTDTIENDSADASDDESDDDGSGNLEFTIAGTKFTTNNNPYEFATKFDISFKQGKFLTDKEFRSKYVTPLVREWKNSRFSFEAVCSESTIELINLGVVQSSGALFKRESDVETLFRTNIQTPCKDPIENYMIDFCPGVFKQFKDYMIQKLLTVVDDTNEALPVVDDTNEALPVVDDTNEALPVVDDTNEALPDITPEFGNQRTLKYTGIDSIPDFAVGYRTKVKNKDHIIAVTAIGEIKRENVLLGSTFKLMEKAKSKCIFDERGVPLSVDYSSLPAVYDNQVLNHATAAPLDDFKLTIIKIVTESVHSGASKMVITDYEVVILIELDPSFKCAGKSEYNGSTQHVLKHLKFYMIETTKTEYSRLYLILFLWSNAARVKKDKKFKANALAYLMNQRNINRATNERSRVAGGEESRADATFQGQPAQGNWRNQQLARGTNTFSSSSNVSSDPATEFSDVLMSDDTEPTDISQSMEKRAPFKIEVFTEEYLVGLDEVVISFLKFGFFDAIDLFVSQVMVISVSSFLSDLNPETVFPIDYEKTTCILKVFDSSWNIHKREFQDAVDASICEIKAYETLEHLKITPEIMAYGILVDDSIRLGQFYVRASGPYLVLSQLDKSQITKDQVTKDMVDKDIKPVFQKLHLNGIVHNNISFENIIIETCGTIKLIDFANSFRSWYELDHMSEISKLYSYFGFAE